MDRLRVAWVCASAAALAISGCGGSRAGGTGDGGGGVVGDGGTPDAGTVTDAGRVADAGTTSDGGAGDSGVLLRIQAGPLSDALIVNTVELCFDAN